MIEALDEVISSYNNLDIDRRMTDEDDAASIIHHIVKFLPSSDSIWQIKEVMLRGLILLENICYYYPHLLLAESISLFPLLWVGLHTAQYRILKFTSTL